MKFIAIKDNSFMFINQETDQQALINEGYILYTEEEYEIYLQEYSQMNLEQTLSMLEEKADEYIEFGTNLWNTVKKKTFAINTYNRSQGLVLSIAEMKTLLASSDLLEKTLTTGSFDTAKDVAVGMSASLPQYKSISDFIILEINTYLEII